MSTITGQIMTSYSIKRRINPSIRRKFIIFSDIYNFGRLVMVKMTNQILYGTIAIATILFIMVFKKAFERENL